MVFGHLLARLAVGTRPSSRVTGAIEPIGPVHNLHAAERIQWDNGQLKFSEFHKAKEGNNDFNALITSLHYEPPHDPDALITTALLQGLSAAHDGLQSLHGQKFAQHQLKDERFVQRHLKNDKGGIITDAGLNAAHGPQKGAKDSQALQGELRLATVGQQVAAAQMKWAESKAHKEYQKLEEAMGNGIDQGKAKEQAMKRLFELQFDQSVAEELHSEGKQIAKTIEATNKALEKKEERELSKDALNVDAGKRMEKNIEATDKAVGKIKGDVESAKITNEFTKAFQKGEREGEQMESVLESVFNERYKQSEEAEKKMNLRGGNGKFKQEFQEGLRLDKNMVRYAHGPQVGAADHQAGQQVAARMQKREAQAKAVKEYKEVQEAIGKKIEDVKAEEQAMKSEFNERYRPSKDETKKMAQEFVRYAKGIHTQKKEGKGEKNEQKKRSLRQRRRSEK